MLNYNQKYKDDVIVTVTNSDNNMYYDNSVSSNPFFIAVGQKTKVTSDYLDVSTLALCCVKPDNILNFNNSPSIEIYDKDETIGTIDISNGSKYQWSRIDSKLKNTFRISTNSENITFDNFSPIDGMTIPINNLSNQTNVRNFTTIANIPADIKCNYTTGKHQYVSPNSINIVFNGDMKTGDIITIKRDNRADIVGILNFDTDLIMINVGMDTSSKLDITYTQKTPVTYKCTLSPTLQNATLIKPEKITDEYGDSAYYLDPEHNTITVKANDGYIFDIDGTLTSQSDTFTIKATHTDTVTFSLPSDINWSTQKSFNLTIGAVKPTIVETSGGFTNIYKADYTNLLNFSSDVIAKISGSSSQAYDVTRYINNLVILPFNVPSGENSAIVAGNSTYTTQLPTVNNNYLTIDLGKITVPEQYKNGFDYYQVKTRLMLPYTNSIELDPIHVINKTISIKYIVNVVNGDTTINIYNNNDLFYSDQVNLANEVPFISKAQSGTQYAVINKLKTHYRNEINQAYIIIEQPTPILNADYYLTNEKGTLKNYTGNVKAKLLNNIDINSNDLISLQNLLETGVNIKWV